jgi:hypothetical protein
VRERAGQVVGEQTAAARFISPDPAVVTVDAGGTVRAVGDGMATVTALHGEQKATVRVSVRKAREAFTWSFRNHPRETSHVTRIPLRSGAPGAGRLRCPCAALRRGSAGPAAAHQYRTARV